MSVLGLNAIIKRRNDKLIIIVKHTTIMKQTVMMIAKTITFHNYFPLQ